jgi:hypothetical protein
MKPANLSIFIFIAILFATSLAASVSAQDRVKTRLLELNGLAGIGGDEAADILIRAMKTQPRKEEKQIIRTALDKIREQSSDPLLKDKIEKALATE